MTHLAGQCKGIRVVVAGDLACFCHIQAVLVPDDSIGLFLARQKLMKLYMGASALAVYQCIDLNGTGAS